MPLKKEVYHDEDIRHLTPLTVFKMHHSETFWPVRSCFLLGDLLDKHGPTGINAWVYFFYFLLWTSIPSFWLFPFKTNKRSSTIGTSLPSDVSGPESSTRRKPDMGSECTFVRLVWCCISYRIGTASLQTPLPPNTSQPQGIYCDAWARWGGGSLLSLVRGPGCQVMDVWGMNRSSRAAGK